MAASNFIVQGVVTIDAERTFRDKIVILHGLRRRYDSRGVLRQNGHRVSPHYYDIHQLFHSRLGQGPLSDRVLATDCTRHALMFFTSSDLDLRHAQPGSYTIMPAAEMVDALKRDYQAMVGMIFGEVPNFTQILETVRQLEFIINDAP